MWKPAPHTRQLSLLMMTHFGDSSALPGTFARAQTCCYNVEPGMLRRDCAVRQSLRSMRPQALMAPRKRGPRNLLACCRALMAPRNVAARDLPACCSPPVLMRCVPAWVCAAFPEWREVMDEWGARMLASVSTVAEVVARGLGLPADAFTSRMHLGPHLLAPTGACRIHGGTASLQFPT